jgi:hypothetical protein
VFCDVGADKGEEICVDFPSRPDASVRGDGPVALHLGNVCVELWRHHVNSLPPCATTSTDSIRHRHRDIGATARRSGCAQSGAEQCLQPSLNLALGSALATIGLTIPAVAAVSIVLQQPLELGLGAKDQALLAITLLLGVITLGTGRTTVLQGIVHLVIFAVFLFFAVVL